MPAAVQTSEFDPAAFEETLRAGTVKAFAVLDACEQPTIPDMARKLGPEKAVCLYKGDAEQNYWAVAPFLFQVDPDLWSWLSETLNQRPCGILLESHQSLNEIRAHLRKFLTVLSPEGKQWLFRFYDPRVLPKFLESANQQQARELFGLIDCFHAATATLNLGEER